MRLIASFCLAILLCAPFTAFAQFEPIVHCGSEIEVSESNCDSDLIKPGMQAGYKVYGECTFCDLVKLAQRLINFFVAFTVVVATLLFAYAGILYSTSAANEGNISKAHNIFWSVFLGLVFVLAAWLMVDLVMKAFYGNWNDPDPARQGRWGPWNKIVCPDEASNATQRCRPLNSYEEALLTVPGDPPPEMVMNHCFKVQFTDPDDATRQTYQECCTRAPELCSTQQRDQTDMPGTTLLASCNARLVPLAQDGGNGRCVEFDPAAPPPDRACSTCAQITVFRNAGCSYTQGVCQVSSVFMPKVLALKNAVGGLTGNIYVTSAYDASPTHVNICHKLGTCMDIDVVGAAAEPDAIAGSLITVINAAQANGMRAIWEVTSQAAKTALTRQGVPATNIAIVGHATGDHFSIYCSASGGRDFECDGTDNQP